MRFIAPNTPTKSRRQRRQEGQAIVLIALLMLVLFAMLGLAIDSGRAYVDRRDLQAAVDAAALAAGDWYQNYGDLTGATNGALPNGTKVFQTDLHLYSGYTSNTCQGLCPTYVGPLSNLPQYTYVVTYPNLTLTIVATNTQFNGYQFVFSATHQLPLAFMQIFGGPTTATITATATAIVGNQRQNPALLTLSSANCATSLQGAGSLTVLGDVYTNGTACVGAGLRLAGNCYGAAGSACSSASYFCYNANPGFVPYDPNGVGPPPHPVGSCAFGDILGAPYVPAPTLPDPGYLSLSQPYYAGPGVSTSHGTYTELTPGSYTNFALSGPGCYFLDAGIYSWQGGYSSHGGMVSNELKPPDEGLYSAPGTSSQTGIPINTFWGAGGCAGSFTVTVVPAPGNGLHHNGSQGVWGVELTSVRYDRFLDPTITPNPCSAAPGCMRESAPSACHETAVEIDGNSQGIAVSVTVNSPGAQYYNVYVDPNGCVGSGDNAIGASRNNFTFINTFPAPVAGILASGVAPGGWPCGVAAVTICNVSYNQLNTPGNNCGGQARAIKNCRTSDDETAPTCFSVCPPAAAVPQENAAMSLEYPPYTSGDVTNENYCMQTPIFPAGLAATPCVTAKITPGAVQFYMGPADCLDQNGNGYTHVFSGAQYNWIVIYQAPAVAPAVPPLCAPNGNKLLGNALTQYIGTIYSPSSNWTIQGSDKSPLSGQVICWQATVTGSGQAGIDYNPNYAPVPPAARLIN